MLTTTQVQALTDSPSQAFADFTTVMAATMSGGTTMNTIINGVSGTGATNTVGRVLLLNDLVGELNLLSAVNQAANGVLADLNGRRSLLSFYTNFFAFFDKLDQTVASPGVGISGLNGYLTANGMQVSGYFAQGFNYWCSTLTTLSPGRSALPTPISALNCYPTSAIDSMYTFTCSTGTLMSTQAQGATTASAGGGIGQFSIYKSNAGATVAGATFTITYVTGSGTTATATYTTATNVPTPSGSLAASFTISGCIGQAITNVSGTGMTAGESYVIGMKQVRSLQGY